MFPFRRCASHLQLVRGLPRERTPGSRDLLNDGPAEDRPPFLPSRRCGQGRGLRVVGLQTCAGASVPTTWKLSPSLASRTGTPAWLLSAAQARGLASPSLAGQAAHSAAPATSPHAAGELADLMPGGQPGRTASRRSRPCRCPSWAPVCPCAAASRRRPLPVLPLQPVGQASPSRRFLRRHLQVTLPGPKS